MHSPLRQQLLDSALLIISQARPLVDAVARRDRDLGSQLRRALNSVALNLAEGLGSAAGNARLRFESARGSLYEAHTALRVAVAWDYIADADCTPILTVLALRWQAAISAEPPAKLHVQEGPETSRSFRSTPMAWQDALLTS